MSVDEGPGSTNAVLDLKRFRSDAIQTKIRWLNEQEQNLLKKWPSILWTMVMLIIGVAGVGGFIISLVLRGGNSKSLSSEDILATFSISLGFSGLMSVFIRYMIVAPQCNR